MAGNLSTERVAGIAGGHPAEPDPASKRRSVMGLHSRLKSHRKRKRVSAKISHLVGEGKPQKQAVAIAHQMERDKRLGPRGGYKRGTKE